MTKTPPLKNKHILFGVCGSIAAYKSVYLLRLLKKKGASVQVLMTEGALDFIRPLTFSSLSDNPVYTQFHQPDTGVWNNHVELTEKSDLLLIAPASANTIAKMANGLCDNLLTAAYLSCQAPVMIAPAMDREMYQHPSTSHNLATLQQYGHQIISGEKGELASGLVGQGRMAEPDRILQEVESTLAAGSESSNSQPFAGQKALVTAGPTYEPIDAVRYIGNYSSGKMGFAIAESLAQQGAQVTLVTGPTKLKTTHSSIKRVDVTTTEEMAEACQKVFPECNLAILAAAVADLQPRESYPSKRKKEDFPSSLPLEPTTDILAALGKQKTSEQQLVGFALESENEVDNAREKLDKKNLDFIVMNSLNDENSTFQSDRNKVTIIDQNGTQTPYPLQSKEKVAERILEHLHSSRSKAPSNSSKK